MARSIFSKSFRTARNNGRNLFAAVFSATWNSLAGGFIGTYDSVDPRNTAMRGVLTRPSTPADLASSVPYLRNLCRNFERNNASARAMTEGFVANVVGSGIALEPDTGDAATDAKLREVWNEYTRDCFIDRSELFEGERLACREVFVAGESLWRMVIDPDRAKDGLIPLCVQPYEPEWLGDSGQTLTGSYEGYIGGVKLDKFGRAVSYSLISPAGLREEVPADKMIHAYERRRALQFRGEPMMAPILTTLRQEKDLVMAELEAAKNTAGFAAAITTNGGMPSEVDEKGEAVRDIKLGTVLELQQGEDIKVINHTRPSQQIAPFRDMLRGDMAGAVRLGKRWIDRDISGANYSSMRADMLDNERLLAPVREWFGHQTVGKLYQAVLPYLCLKAGVEMPKRKAYRLVPDGQPYVDPLKDAQAAAMSIAFGLSTYEQEIGKRGGDYRQVWQKLAEERAELDRLGIVIQTPSGMLVGDEEAMALGGDDSNPPGKSPSGRPSKPVAGPPGKAAGTGESGKKPDEREHDLLIRSMELNRELAAKPHAAVNVTTNVPPSVTHVMATVESPTVNLRQEAQAAPTVNVSVEPTAVPVQVTNEIRQEAQAAPVVNVSVQSASPDVIVQPSAANVTVENEVIVPQRTVKAIPQSDGTTLIKPVDK